MQNKTNNRQWSKFPPRPLWHRLQKFQCGREKGDGALSPFVKWDAVTLGGFVPPSPLHIHPCFCITTPTDTRGNAIVIQFIRTTEFWEMFLLGIGKATAHEEPRAVCWYNVFAILSFHSMDFYSASGVFCQIRNIFLHDTWEGVLA